MISHIGGPCGTILKIYPDIDFRREKNILTSADKFCEDLYVAF